MNHDTRSGNRDTGRLRECLLDHPLFGRDEALVGEAASCAELIQLGFDDVLIGRGRKNADLYLIFSGSVDVLVDDREVARKGEGEIVGEMELVAPHLKRVATVVSRDNTMVGRIPEPAFAALAERYPILWRKIAAGLVDRFIRETAQ